MKISKAAVKLGARIIKAVPSGEVQSPAEAIQDAVEGLAEAVKRKLAQCDTCNGSGRGRNTGKTCLVCYDLRTALAPWLKGGK